VLDRSLTFYGTRFDPRPPAGYHPRVPGPLASQGRPRIAAVCSSLHYFAPLCSDFARQAVAQASGLRLSRHASGLAVGTAKRGGSANRGLASRTPDYV
jgi:hypothetical protein